jgi:hypothetical protein
MNNGQIDRRFVELMAGLFLLLIAFAAGDAGIAWVFGMAGLYLLFRQFNRSRAELGGDRRFGMRGLGDRRQERAASFDDTEPHMVTDEPSGTQIYAHALDAVRRAGIDPAQSPVLPIDLGLMAFRGNQQPALHRTRPVLDDADFVQPFVQLKLATRAAGKVRFEIVDSDGQLIFIHEDYHQLKPGLNLITPAARLPIHDAQAKHGDWLLRLSADGILLAEHRFAWLESTEKVIRRHVQVDGELSNEMRRLLDDSRPEKMSLDELLAEQERSPSGQQAHR